MNRFLLSIIVPLAMLVGCAEQPKESLQQKSEMATPVQHQGPSPEELKRMVKSQQLYYNAEQAFQSKDPAKGFDFLEQGVHASREEKNIAAALLCRETAAKMYLSMSDRAKAMKTLESSLAEFDKPGLDVPGTVRMDGIKAFLASLYATSGSQDKAELIYKKALAAARADKPVSHQRVAFWLRNFADFYKFKKDEKKSKEFETQSLEEMKKSG